MKLTTCPLDCFDGCSIEVTEDLKLKGNRNHPITQGFLCPHLNHYHKFETINSPTLNGKEISLESALQKLTELLKQSEPSKTLYFKGSGNLGSMQSITRKFFATHDTHIAKGSLCEEAGTVGIEEGRGASLVLSPTQVTKSEVVIIWGRNPSTTNSHMLKALKDKTLIVIDPVSIDLAQHARLHVKVKPRGDIYLAMLLARSAYMEQMEDEEFIENRCENFDYYIDFINAIPMKKLMDRSGVKLSKIGEILSIIKGKKVSFLVGLGVQKYSHGHSVLRAIDSFAALLGLFGKEGCGVGYIDDSAFGFQSHFSVSKNSVDLPTVDFGKYDLVFIQGANPMSQMPCTPKVKEGLEKAKFVVYFGLHVNQTSQQADLVIPAKTFLEKEDLKLSYGHEYIGYMPKIHESGFGISEYDLCTYLMDTFSYGSLKSEKEYIEEIVSSNSVEKDGFLISKTYEQIPYEEKFYTKSGKFEFFDEFYDEADDEEEGFYLLHVKHIKSLNSQFEPNQFLYVPLSLGLYDEQKVKLSNDSYECEYIIKVDDRLRDDCLLLYSGHKNANMLTPHKTSQEGKNAIFQEGKVRLEVING
jgi:anaerobic selenocysteine-containing dehydrogenase